MLSIYANDPDQLKDTIRRSGRALQESTARTSARSGTDLAQSHELAVVAAPAASVGGARCFPRSAPSSSCRACGTRSAASAASITDPIAAWEAHCRARGAHATAERQALHRVAVSRPRHRSDGRAPDGHVWVSGQIDQAAGDRLRAQPADRRSLHDAAQGSRRRDSAVDQAAQLRRHADRGLRAALREAAASSTSSAERGRAVLRKLVATDEGAARLGEVALVPHSSPISQSGLLFYNTLFDENAASHVALGLCLQVHDERRRGDDRRGIRAAGGNRSAAHVDFMIGSGELDIDGVLADGKRRAADAPRRVDR